MTDEEQLIARASAGDRDAFRRLYELHREKVARLAYRVMGGPADLEDVVQEVFVQVHKSLPDFRGQAKFGTWLHRVTINVVLMHRRAARSRPTFTGPPPDERIASADEPAPDDDAERRERIRAFGRLLGRLAEKKRIVFILHDLEGVPPTDIARIVGAPVLTVRTRLFYARRELEGMLGDEPALAGVHIGLAKASEARGA
jgi:RNA polymerase sigma-70 factor (ECF subfamily)